MKIARANSPDFVIGKRVVLGQIIGAACAWGFWLGETFWGWDVPAAMVTQATTLLLGVAQIWIANKFGVTTP